MMSRCEFRVGSELPNASDPDDVGSKNYSCSQPGDIPVFEEGLFVTLVAKFELYLIPVICFVGIIGNVLSFLVFLCTYLRRTSASIYLAALSLADLCFLVGAMISWLSEVGVHLDQQNGWCQLNIYLKYVSYFLSVWYIVSFTTERYIAVHFPLKRNHLCTPKRSQDCGLFLGRGRNSRVCRSISVVWNENSPSRSVHLHPEVSQPHGQPEPPEHHHLSDHPLCIDCLHEHENCPQSFQVLPTPRESERRCYCRWRYADEGDIEFQFQREPVTAFRHPPQPPPMPPRFHPVPLPWQPPSSLPDPRYQDAARGVDGLPSDAPATPHSACLLICIWDDRP